MRTRLVFMMLLCALLTVVCFKGAYGFTVTNNNSTITVDPTSQFGLKGWVVNGINHISEQWFWYRLEGETFETPLNSLSRETQEIPSSHQIHFTFNEILAGLQVDVLYTLIGGPSGNSGSRINELITFTNLDDQPLNPSLKVSWFMEADLDLNSDGSMDSATGGVGGITQTDGQTIAWVKASPTPNAFQIADTFGLLDLLDDHQLTNLDNTGSPFGPGDVTFAFQWNVTIPAGQSATIAISKVIAPDPVPEPTTLLLLGTGLAGLLGGRWYQRRRAV